MLDQAHEGKQSKDLALMVSLYQTELERVKYVLKSYLHIRLKKVPGL